MDGDKRNGVDNIMKKRLIEELLRLVENEDVVILDMHGDYDFEDASRDGQVESIPTGHSTITFNLFNKEVHSRFIKGE